MANIIVREKEPLEYALKRFKKKVENEGTIKEFRERQYYKKPSEKKRQQKKEAIRKAKIKQLRQDKKTFRDK